MPKTNCFTIGPFHHLETDKNHCAISPQKHISILKQYNPFTISITPYHNFTILPLHHCTIFLLTWTLKLNKNISNKEKKSKDTLTLPTNMYKNISRTADNNYKENIDAENNNPSFSEWSNTPKEVIKVFEITDNISHNMLYQIWLILDPDIRVIRKQ